MTRLVHLSDLRFGRVWPELRAPLVEAVNGLRPDLVVISGDLTQRARNAQFQQARAFLDALTAPWLAVPDNHDVPLDRPLSRLLRPYAGYRRWIDPMLAPQKDIGRTRIIGVNTVNPLDWQRGRLSRRRIAWLGAALAAPGPALRVVVAHHPLVHQPQERKALLRGARAGLSALADSRADVVLSGHLHSWRAAPFAPDGEDAWAMLMVQAGTGLSTRLRGAPNDFNLLNFEDAGLTLSRFTAGDGDAAFVEAHVQGFERGARGWRSAPPGRGTDTGPLRRHDDMTAENDA